MRVSYIAFYSAASGNGSVRVTLSSSILRVLIYILQALTKSVTNHMEKQKYRGMKWSNIAARMQHRKSTWREKESLSVQSVPLVAVVELIWNALDVIRDC